MKFFTLADYATGYENNLNLVRFMAAALVIVAHCYPLTGTPESQSPMMRLVGVDGGTIGVNIFFMLSGLLISASYLRNSDWVRYVQARVLRIYPGLIVAVLLSAYLFGLIFTTTPRSEFVGHPQTLEFLAVNSSLIGDGIQMRYQLPGVFEDNPTPYAVNGSLWTLPYEMWMYALLLGLGVTGILRRRLWTNLFIAGLVVCYVIAQWLIEAPLFYKLDNFERFTSFFLVGVGLYINRDWVPIHWLGVILLTGIAIAARDTTYYGYLFSAALLYGVLWFGYVPGGLLRRFNEWGDYSYGLYIYAFPVQQGLVASFPEILPLPLGLSAFGISLLFAIGSWHLVEERALRLKRANFLSWGRPTTMARS